MGLAYDLVLFWPDACILPVADLNAHIALEISASELPIAKKV